MVDDAHGMCVSVSLSTAGFHLLGILHCPFGLGHKVIIFLLELLHPILALRFEI